MAKVIYSSPGTYGSVFTSSYNVPLYFLNAHISPSISAGFYKWKIAEVDKDWRDSYKGKRLARDQYTVQWSMDLENVLGSYPIYLNNDTTITINVSA